MLQKKLSHASLAVESYPVLFRLSRLAAGEEGDTLNIAVLVQDRFRARLRPGGERGVRRRQSAGMERAKGIEPSYAAWEAAVLPLNYTRLV